MLLNSLLLCCGTALGPAFILLFDEFCSFQSVLQVTDAAVATFVFTFVVIS